MNMGHGESRPAPADVLAEAVERITRSVNHYHRDAPFRAPETVPEWQARLLNDIWSVLTDAHEDLAPEGQHHGGSDA
jgi:hypothetical protein